MARSNPDEFAANVKDAIDAGGSLVSPGFYRKSMSTTVWTDAKNVDYDIESMPPSHAANAYGYLFGRAIPLAQMWLATLTWMSARDASFEAPDSDLVYLAMTNEREWAAHLPVMKALRARFRRPEQPLTVPCAVGAKEDEF